MKSVPHDVPKTSHFRMMRNIPFGVDWVPGNKYGPLTLENTVWPKENHLPTSAQLRPVTGASSFQFRSEGNTSNGDGRYNVSPGLPIKCVKMKRKFWPEGQPSPNSSCLTQLVSDVRKKNHRLFQGKRNRLTNP